VIGMLEDETNSLARRELLRLTRSDDLLDLAREMRDMGVESILFCTPQGRIRQVVTDRQIAHLAASYAAPSAAPRSAEREPVSQPIELTGTGIGVPRQAGPARQDSGVPASRR
jgi:hypothetical protein